MRFGWVLAGLVMMSQVAGVRRLAAQTDAGGVEAVPGYRMKVAVDEVILTFHAEDVQGLPVNDLKLSDLKLLDDGVEARKVVAFELMKDFPIRAGILMDTSSSSRPALPVSRDIAVRCVQGMMGSKMDQAFVMEFGRLSKIVQPWTGNAAALTESLRGIDSRESRGAGTALFDTLLGACLYQFGRLDKAASGNAIVLFTDGEDNASYVDLHRAVDACQRSNTAIYAFRSGTGMESSGPGTLTELAAETGGRVFSAKGSEEEIAGDLKMIEADLRNQYRLVFRPAGMKHDGAFHTIQLTVPERFVSVTVRSGFYAPSR